MGVPTHYTRLLQEPGLDRHSSASVRLFASGSAPLLPETLREFQERTGHTILERYGMTETLINTSNPYAGPRVAGSVGPTLPGISVRVREQESGMLAAADVIGALEVRGPNVFAGYWRDPDKTRAEFTADGWFRTGDLARIDAGGYVWIVGRAKDLVISGGFNVYPKEVEAELNALAGVAESAVFGVRASRTSARVLTAAVVLQAGNGAHRAERHRGGARQAVRIQSTEAGAAARGAAAQYHGQGAQRRVAYHLRRAISCRLSDARGCRGRGCGNGLPASGSRRQQQ